MANFDANLPKVHDKLSDLLLAEIVFRLVFRTAQKPADIIPPSRPKGMGSDVKLEAAIRQRCWVDQVIVKLIMREFIAFIVGVFD